MTTSTRAMDFLRRNRISFEVIRYSHEQKGAAFASEATGFPLARTVKTLVAELGDGRQVLALMPGSQELSVKRLARAFSVKRTQMADIPTAERVTGYLVGGISPFGVRKPLPVVMEETLLSYDLVMINAGQRGVMLRMNPRDILSVLKASACPLSDEG